MIDFGNRVELMTDRYLLAQCGRVSFRGTAPENHGRILSFDRPWEGEGSLALTALTDGRGVRLYYRGFPTHAHDTDAMQTSCLAVSDDGIRFTRPEVNRIDYNGIRENNIVHIGTVCHNFAPFYDPNPACREDERYKAIGGIRETGGISAFASPDGICWRPMADHPVITKGAFDSMNMAFWNPHTGLYHCYSRYMDHTVQSPALPYGCRAIQSCTSEDFVHWTDPVPNVYDGGPTDQLYTNAVRPVPGAEHILVSIPMRFQETRRKDPAYRASGVSDAVLMTSRDGVHWDRTLKDAWIAGGLSAREWTQRCFIAAGGLIPLGDRFYFYMEQNYMWDDDGIWAYSVPKYRFLSLYADAEGGFAVTKPLRFATDEFFLNYSTSAYGYVKITAFGEDGAELFDTGEIFGNELSHRIFREGLSGRTGTLRIELKEAHLYAIGSAM